MSNRTNDTHSTQRHIRTSIPFACPPSCGITRRPHRMGGSMSLDRSLPTAGAAQRRRKGQASRASIAYTHHHHHQQQTARAKIMMPSHPDTQTHTHTHTHTYRHTDRQNPSHFFLRNNRMTHARTHHTSDGRRCGWEGGRQGGKSVTCTDSTDMHMRRMHSHVYAGDQRIHTYIHTGRKEGSKAARRGGEGTSPSGFPKTASRPSQSVLKATMDGWMDDTCDYVCMYVCMYVCVCGPTSLEYTSDRTGQRRELVRKDHRPLSDRSIHK